MLKVGSICYCGRDAIYFVICCAAKNLQLDLAP
jgi:hypothetical protein